MLLSQQAAPALQQAAAGWVVAGAVSADTGLGRYRHAADRRANDPKINAFISILKKSTHPAADVNPHTGVADRQTRAPSRKATSPTPETIKHVKNKHVEKRGKSQTPRARGERAWSATSSRRKAPAAGVSQAMERRHQPSARPA
ncbi:MAG: hypothetical protein ACTHLZ_13950, partial [Tepidisphaeraceae bacterium]